MRSVNEDFGTGCGHCPRDRPARSARALVFFDLIGGGRRRSAAAPMALQSCRAHGPRLPRFDCSSIVKQTVDIILSALPLWRRRARYIQMSLIYSKRILFAKSAESRIVFRNCQELDLLVLQRILLVIFANRSRHLYSHLRHRTSLAVVNG